MAKPKADTLAVTPTGSVSNDLSIESLIAQAIQKGTAVGVMERLLAMRDKLKAEFAKEQFDRAMAAFQADCPTINKTKSVTNNGAVMYKYAPIESIVDQVKPHLLKHGFSYSTSMVFVDDQVTVTLKVTHTDGHSELNNMTVPLGAKTGIMSNTQVVAAAQTFAKRYAFCNAFGILTGDEDNDAAKPPDNPPPPVNPPLNNPPTENVPPAADWEPITEGQIKFIEQLVTKHREDGEQYANLAEFEASAKIKVRELSKTQGQVMIDKLLGRIREINKKAKDAKDAKEAENEKE